MTSLSELVGNQPCGKGGDLGLDAGASRYQGKEDFNLEAGGSIPSEIEDFLQKKNGMWAKAVEHTNSFLRGLPVTYFSSHMSYME